MLILSTLVGVAFTFLSGCRADRPRPSTAGRLIDVGGHRPSLICRGDQKPTVVMGAGDRQDSRAWDRTGPAIAHFARVCVYDRAGLGMSDPSPELQTSRQIAYELHTL